VSELQVAEPEVYDVQLSDYAYTITVVSRPNSAKYICNIWEFEYIKLSCVSLFFFLKLVCYLGERIGAVYMHERGDKADERTQYWRRPYHTHEQVCVCLSRSWVVSKRVTVSSDFFLPSDRATILAFRTKRDGNTPPGIP